MNLFNEGRTNLPKYSASKLLFPSKILQLFICMYLVWFLIMKGQNTFEILCEDCRTTKVSSWPLLK